MRNLSNKQQTAPENRHLSPEEFGRQLIVTGDLDPVYLMLNHADWLGREQLAGWCLAYWCFYHVGVASWISEADTVEDYYRRMMEAAENKTPNKRFPRASERRHFRGPMAMATVKYLQSQTPMQWMGFLAAHRNFKEMYSRAKSIYGFGDWIAFKICDMMDAVLGVPVDFTGCDLAVYSEPRKGAEMALKFWQYSLEEGNPGMHVAEAMQKLSHELKDLKAPHADRPLGKQELETVLCKWKSHFNGHYPVGKDTKEITHALEGWGKTANRLKDGMPKMQTQEVFGL